MSTSAPATVTTFNLKFGSAFAVGTKDSTVTVSKPPEGFSCAVQHTIMIDPYADLCSSGYGGVMDRSSHAGFLFGDKTREIVVLAGNPGIDLEKVLSAQFSFAVTEENPGEPSTRYLSHTFKVKPGSDYVVSFRSGAFNLSTEAIDPCTLVLVENPKK